MDGVLQELLKRCIANADTTLILNYMKLAEIPHDLRELDMVKRLYMKQNLLKAVPLEINMLVSLVSLYLDSNLIEYIPATIGDLSNLESLGLNRNRITHLPKSIGKLSNLKSLQLSHNLITNLPTEIGNLRSLETLNLMSNEIEEIPNEISGCIMLKTLQLDCNKLTCINQEILHLQLLQDLSVSRNMLEYLPFDINYMKSLEELTADANNYLEFLPGSILLSSKLKYFGVNGCRKLEPVYSLAEHSLKVTTCMEVEWIGSESDNITPLKELCIREVGSLKKEKNELLKAFTELPKSLIRVLETPIGSCTYCLRVVYRTIFMMRKEARKILQHCQRPTVVNILASIPKNAFFIFIFCSISCQQAYQKNGRFWTESN